MDPAPVAAARATRLMLEARRSDTRPTGVVRTLSSPAPLCAAVPADHLDVFITHAWRSSLAFRLSDDDRSRQTADDDASTATTMRLRVELDKTFLERLRTSPRKAISELSRRRRRAKRAALEVVENVLTRLQLHVGVRSAADGVASR
jgi:hypothetical protein